MIVQNLAVQRGQWLSFFVVMLFARWRKQFSLYAVENLYWIQ